jgi:NADPH-dependent 7-cyano-7-deazaguanine reductase QueF-like protein
MDGDYSNLSDPELFKLQFNSFDVTKFPEFEETKRLITDLFGTSGRLGSLSEFHEFCDKYKITGISDRYFTDFISTFDSKLYCER